MNPDRIKFIEEHPKNAFNISRTCEVIGISRRTFYDWLRDDEEFRDKMESFRESFIDLSEQVLYRAMKADDLDAAKFVAKHLGKKRGYSDQLDITTNGEPINKIVVEIITKKEDGNQDSGK